MPVSSRIGRIACQYRGNCGIVGFLPRSEKRHVAQLLRLLYQHRILSRVRVFSHGVQCDKRLLGEAVNSLAQG